MFMLFVRVFACTSTLETLRNPQIVPHLYLPHVSLLCFPYPRRVFVRYHQSPCREISCEHDWPLLAAARRGEEMPSLVTPAQRSTPYHHRHLITAASPTSPESRLSVPKLYLHDDCALGSGRASSFHRHSNTNDREETLRRRSRTTPTRGPLRRDAPVVSRPRRCHPS
jgi:hypothetical protein